MSQSPAPLLGKIKFIKRNKHCFSRNLSINDFYPKVELGDGVLFAERTNELLCVASLTQPYFDNGIVKVGLGKA